MSEYNWKIGHWCEYKEQRLFIYDVQEKAIHYVTFGGIADYFAPTTLGVKHLPNCDSWTWQPPKPIEPHEGYRLLVEGEVVRRDDMFFFQDKYWDDVCPEARQSIGDPWSASRNVPFARKVEPKVRPMTRSEFLAAWKQRGFCPLIASNGTVETVDCAVPECGDDKQLIILGNNGWQTFDSLAKNYCFFYGEEPYAPVSIEE